MADSMLSAKIVEAMDIERTNLVRFCDATNVWPANSTSGGYPKPDVAADSLNPASVVCLLSVVHEYRLYCMHFPSGCMATAPPPPPDNATMGILLAERVNQQHGVAFICASKMIARLPEPVKLLSTTVVCACCH